MMLMIASGSVPEKATSTETASSVNSSSMSMMRSARIVPNVL